MTQRLPSSLLRYAAASALALAAFLPAAIASATPGTITLTGGEVLSGDITEVVNGDHITMRLPGGQLRIVTWAQIGLFQISGGASVTVGGTAAGPGPTPTPPPTYTPAPAPPPPAYGAPPPAYGPPPPAYAPPPPPPRYYFRPTWTVGGRLSTHSISGTLDSRTGATIQDYVGVGGAGEIDLGWRWSPYVTGYVGLEISGYSTGKANAAFQNVSTPWGAWVGLGLQGTTNPRGLGFYWDVATGVRMLQLSYTGSDGVNYNANYSGWEIIRGGIGLSISGDHANLNVIGWASYGLFTSVSDSSCNRSYWGSACDTPISASSHAVYGLAVSGNVDLF